jgi:predicted ATPase
LLDLVWPGLVVEENNLQVQVGTLRKLLGAGAIATLPGRGYRFTLADGSSGSPAPPGDGSSTGLPPDRTPFVGREAELATGAVLLARTRLLTLTGIGGSGKTRLAIALARRVLVQHAKPHWFVDLAPLHGDGRVVPAVASALQLPDREATRPEDIVAEAIGIAPALLLLDNCETAVAGAAALVDSLLTRCPGLCVLATSRVPLGIAGETRYAVPPLGVPAAAGPGDPPLSDAERLFADQARRVAPDLVLDVPARRDAVARICRGLDGLPLALELAASRVAVLDVAEIADRLDQRFRLLAGGSERPARQQTLETVLAWSWEHLSPAEQRVLARLSVFAAGCTLEAAACVTEAGDELDLLDHLAALQAHALVTVDTSAPGGTRYRLLDTVRAWAARELARRGETDAARELHLRAMLARAGALRHIARTRERLAALALELEDLLAAHRWCGEDPTRAVDGLRLVAPLMALLTGAGLIELGRTVFAEALHRPGAAAAGEPRARALLALGKLQYFAGEAIAARETFEQALELARQIGHAALAARLMADSADTHVPGGEPVVATQRASAAVAAARQLPDDEEGRLVRAVVLNASGTVWRWTGDERAAAAAYEEALMRKCSLARRAIAQTERDCDGAWALLPAHIHGRRAAVTHAG